MKILPTILFVLSLIAPAPATIASETPEDFFTQYVQLGNEFNPALADLYSTQALIRSYRVYPQGIERHMEVTGAQWKQFLVKVLPLAQAQNDKSTFSNIDITQISDGFKIQADRYSIRKCYVDTGYFMIVKPTSNGRLLIIEEYLETQPQSSC